jgi:hypothetical protein
MENASALPSPRFEMLSYLAPNKALAKTVCSEQKTCVADQHLRCRTSCATRIRKLFDLREVTLIGVPSPWTQTNSFLLKKYSAGSNLNCFIAGDAHDLIRGKG